MRAACFLDRDGTLIEERGYNATAGGISLLPGAAEAVRLLNRSDVAAVLVTNQSGVGRGFFTTEALAEQHDRLERLLEETGARLDGIYVCPHHPERGCACRKPGTALLERAASELALDLERSWVVGDRVADVTCGERGAAGGILVRTGYGDQEADTLDTGIVCPDVLAAVRHLLASVWSGDR